jgi:hypothetical protein
MEHRYVAYKNPLRPGAVYSAVLFYEVQYDPGVGGNGTDETDVRALELSYHGQSQRFPQ